MKGGYPYNSEGSDYEQWIDAEEGIETEKGVLVFVEKVSEAISTVKEIILGVVRGK